MTKEEAIKAIEEHLDTADEAGHVFPIQFLNALDMAISALKDIEKIQIIVDAYFTRGSKSGYECMVEIDRFLEHYKKGE